MDSTQGKAVQSKGIPAKAELGRSSLSQEVEKTIERLVRLSLSTAKEPLDWPRSAAREKTKHYDLTVSCDSTTATVELTLHRSEIEQDVIKNFSTKASWMWDFVGYVTPEPLSLDELARHPDFRRNATLRTNASGKFVLPLQQGVPTHALFFVAVETADVRFFDSEFATTLHAFSAPTLDEIVKLKERLVSLLEGDISGSPDDRKSFEAQMSDIINRSELMKEGIAKRDINKEDKDVLFEQLEGSCREALSNLIEDYQK